MKKIITTSITVITVLAVMFTLTMPMTAQAKSTPKLNKTKISLNVKKSYQLKITGVSKKVAWKSNNKKVATVSKTGKVTAKKKGTAVITAKVSGKAYKCKVTVGGNYRPARKVKLNKTKVSLNMAKTKKCQLKVTGTSKKATWKTSNKKVAVVSKTGMVTAKKKGTAVITAKISGKAYKCKVTVKDTRKTNSEDGDTMEEDKTEEPNYVAIHPIKIDKDGHVEGPRYQCTCGTPIHADIEGEWERHVWLCREMLDIPGVVEHQLIPIKEYKYPTIACSCGLAFYLVGSMDALEDGYGMHDMAYVFYEEFTHGKPGHIHEDPPGNNCHSFSPMCPYNGKHDDCPYHSN